MSDTINIANLLNLNVSSSALGSGTSLLGEIGIISLPPDLLNLENTQILEGKILSVKKDGLVMISTEYGNVTINTDTPSRLQNKKEIELRIEAGNPPTKAILRPPPSEVKDKEADKAQRFDAKTFETTLTKDAQALNAALLDARLLLSGVPLQMTILGSGEPIAQPFMRQTSSSLTPLQTNTFNPLVTSTTLEQSVETAKTPTGAAPPKQTSEAGGKQIFYNDKLENNTPTHERSLYSLTNTEQPILNYGSSFQAEITPQTKAEAVALPLQNAQNSASLPFRSVAAQVIKTSSETRISYKIVPNEPTAVGQKNTQEAVSKESSPALEYTIANNAEIKVRTVSPPLVQFTNNGSTESQKTVHRAQNPHFTPIQAGRSNNSELLSSTLFSSQVGSANAVVEGFTQTRSFPVLRMLTPGSLSERLYALDVPVQSLPMGSQLEFEINLLHTNKRVSNTTAGVLDKSTTMMNAFQFLTPGNWPVMEEVQQSLIQVSPQSAQAFNAVLPSPNAPAQLGASVLFFVAALRSGDVQNWLGEKAVDNLKRSGKGSLLGRMNSEFLDLAKVGKERVSGEWRAISIPLAWQNEVDKLVIYTSNEDGDANEDEQQSKGSKTRFVVDISLSHIGPLQLDGLFSGSLGDASGETRGRLDLVLRTEQGFSKAMKQQMREAYKSALDETHITGELSFQDHTLDWVRITPSETAEYSRDA